MDNAELQRNEFDKRLNHHTCDHEVTGLWTRAVMDTDAARLTRTMDTLSDEFSFTSKEIFVENYALAYEIELPKIVIEFDEDMRDDCDTEAEAITSKHDNGEPDYILNDSAWIEAPDVTLWLRPNDDGLVIETYRPGTSARPTETLEFAGATLSKGHRAEDVYILNPRERDIIIAALRLWQDDDIRKVAGDWNRLDALTEIATNSGRQDAVDDVEIDILIQDKLNR